MSESSTMDMVLQRLLMYRRGLQLSQDEFSKYIGSSQSNYSDVERGVNIMTYHFLNGLYQYDCDIDYFFAGIKTTVKDNVFEKLLDSCDVRKRTKLYTLMITGFLEIWDGMDDNIWTKCLLSELRAMNILLMQKGDLKNRLYYVRILHKMSQKEFGNLMGIGRSKCGECEHGKNTVDAYIILRLYNNGLTLPSFFFEDYIGIRAISHLLEENEELKRRYCHYLESVATDIIGDKTLLQFIRNPGV